MPDSERLLSISSILFVLSSKHLNLKAQSDMFVDAFFRLSVS